MSVFRVNKSKDFTVMSNRHFREKEMSLKAKGLLSLMLSLPDDWDYSIAGLASICKENDGTIKSILNELKDFKYLRVDKIMPDKTESGRIEYVYNIYEFPYEDNGKNEINKQDIAELPIEKQEVEKQGVEKQEVEKQGVVFYTQLNTNNKINNNIIYNNKNTNNKNTNKININKYIDIYNRVCVNLPKILKTTDKRKNAILKYIKEYSEEDFEKECKMAQESDFLSGRNGKWTNCNFDWLININNAVKVLEGNYKNKTGLNILNEIYEETIKNNKGDFNIW